MEKPSTEQRRLRVSTVAKALVLAATGSLVAWALLHGTSAREPNAPVVREDRVEMPARARVRERPQLGPETPPVALPDDSRAASVILQVSVVDSGGLPVRDAVVEVRPLGANDPQTSTGITSIDGTVELSAPASADVLLQARRTAGAVGVSARVRLPSAGAHSHRLMLDVGTHQVTGHLKEAGDMGRPVCGMVEVLGDGLKVRSDDSGRFVIRDVHESAVIRLRATAEGLAPAHAVAYPGSPVTIALERGTEILGRVITASGAPVLGARIRCFSTVHEGGRYQLIDLHAVTNAEGTFRIAGVRRSTEARLQIDAPSVGKARITVAPERLAGDRFDVGDVVPIGGFSVTGTLTDSQGAPLPGLTIHLLQQPGPPGWSEWSTTSKDGTFDFRDLPPGRYRISTSLGAVSAIETIDLGGEAVRNVALRLAATRALRVVVVDENGSGVAGVTVDVRFPDLRSSTTQSTGDDGVAEIRFDRARPDRVSVSGDDGAGRPIVPAAPTFPVVGDEMRIPVRRGSRVHGQVVDVQGRPVPGAQLRAVRDGEVLGETWADTTGDFLIVVPRRDATIVTATGFARVLTGGGGYVDADQAWVGSAPVHPEASVAVRVEVRPATRQHVTARLQLHDGRGTPLGGVPLIATRGEQRRVEYDRRTTDGAGIAMFDLPGEGLYRFLAAGAATDEGFSMTVPAEEEAVWRLPADRSLVGSVVPVVGGMTGRVRLEKDGREVAAADVTPEGSFVLISAYPIRGSAELRLTVTYRGGEPSEFRRWVTVPEPSRVVLVAR